MAGDCMGSWVLNFLVFCSVWGLIPMFWRTEIKLVPEWFSLRSCSPPSSSFSLLPALPFSSLPFPPKTPAKYHYIQDWWNITREKMEGMLYKRWYVFWLMVLPACVLETKAAKWKCIDCGLSFLLRLSQQLSGKDYPLASVCHWWSWPKILPASHVAAPSLSFMISMIEWTQGS